MPREVREMEIRQALNRVAGMPFKWSLNPYRGCQHACTYCYARATHRFLNLGSGSDFSQILFAKINLAAVLEREITRAGWTGERVALGTATDPYQPLEGRYKITRQCLEVLLRHRNPVQIITKGTLVQRDTDLLAELARLDLVEVLFSVPTIDPRIWRWSEPGTPSPANRLKALSQLAAAGVPVGVLMAPLLPGISDSHAQIMATIRAVRDAGALFVDGHPVRLAPEVKPVYFQFLEAFYPDLLPQYQLWYKDGRNPPAFLRQRTARRLEAARAGVGLPGHRPVSRLAAAAARQLAWPF
jgi:DNA repair photolyase